MRRHGEPATLHLSRDKLLREVTGSSRIASINFEGHGGPVGLAVIT